MVMHLNLVSLNPQLIYPSNSTRWHKCILWFSNARLIAYVVVSITKIFTFQCVSPFAYRLHGRNLLSPITILSVHHPPFIIMVIHGLLFLSYRHWWWIKFVWKFMSCRISITREHLFKIVTTHNRFKQGGLKCNVNFV